jgi:hypothetical protein
MVFARLLGTVVAGTCMFGTFAAAENITGKWYGTLENYNLSDPRRTLMVADNSGKLSCTFDEVGLSVDAPAKCSMTTTGVLDLTTAANNRAQLVLSGANLSGTLTFTNGRGTFQIVMNRTPHVIVETPPIRWRASMDLVGGIFRNCGDPPFSNYRFEIKGKALTGEPENGESYYVRRIRLNLSSLQPDGSGQVKVVSAKGVSVVFDFDAGTGPRKIRVANQNIECRYVFQPF